MTPAHCGLGAKPGGCGQHGWRQQPGQDGQGPGRQGPHTLTHSHLIMHKHTQTHSDTITGSRKHSQSAWRHTPNTTTQRNSTNQSVPFQSSCTRPCAIVHTPREHGELHCWGSLAEWACAWTNVYEGLFGWCLPDPGLITLSGRVITAGTPPKPGPQGPGEGKLSPGLAL